MKSVLGTAATCLVSSVVAMKEISPGVFSIPLTKSYVKEHPNLQQVHPRVGNWSDSEMWNHEVKEPIENLDNYMYAVDCTIGDIDATKSPPSTYTNQFRCVFDTTTSWSSTFATSFTDYSDIQYNPAYSSDAKLQGSGVSTKWWSLGMQFEGDQYTDTWCLGYSDPHVTVCMEDQWFGLIDKQFNPNQAQWDPPFKSFGNVAAIIGLGTYPIVEDDDVKRGFIDKAFQNGLIGSNMYSFQGVYDEPTQAHVTIGGYNYQDMSGNIEWFNMTYAGGWKLNITNITLDHINLMEAPPAPAEDTQYLGADSVTVIPSYAHFNSGYPFIGVDEYVGDLIEADLYQFRPDISCDYDATKNPWNICYVQEACNADDFRTNLTFAFGTNAMFTLPTSALLQDYTVNSEVFCAVMIQSLPKMSNVFDTDAERHFYFGDVFFKQYVGIFDQGNGLMGVALSSKASTGVEFACAGNGCVEPDEEEEYLPDAPVVIEPEIYVPQPPAPTPTPTPTPDPETGSDTPWMWIGISSGLLLLFLIAIFLVFYYRHQSRVKDRTLALVGYANTNDGDLIEKDVESYAGKGDMRNSQFEDHQDMMANSREIVEDEPIPSPYALQ